MGESCQKYDSDHEMMQSMNWELERLVSSEISNHCFTVWRSKNNDELRRCLGTYLSTTNTSRGTGLLVMDEIKLWLESVCMDNYLFQFWAPVTIGDKRYLTTSDQPFALAQLGKGLCSYRGRCLRWLIPIDDMRTEEGRIGPPGRVLRNRFPEVCVDVRHYTFKEYPLRNDAVTCGIRCYLAFPLYKFGGVIEVVANAFQNDLCEFAKLLLRNYEPYNAEAGTLNAFGVVADHFRTISFAIAGSSVPDMMSPADELKRMLRALCKTHQLPLAQTWVSIPYSSKYKNVVRYEEKGSYITHIEFRDFAEACSALFIQKGRGVVGKAFSSKGACFCKDVRTLSIDEYSLVPNARHAGLTGCFAISLMDSSSFLEYAYIVELFLPSNEAASGDPRTLIKMLLSTMKQHLRRFQVTFMQDPGEKLTLEVIRTSHSPEICDLTGIDSTPITILNGGDMVDLDDIMINADFVNFPGGDGVASPYLHEETGPSMLNEFPGNMYGNPRFPEDMHEGMSSPHMMDPYAGKNNAGRALDDEGGANVFPNASNLNQGLFDAGSHAENVHNAEQLIVSAEQCNTNIMAKIVQIRNGNINANGAEENVFSMELPNTSSMGVTVQHDDAITISHAENMNVNGAEQNIVSMEQRDTNSNISKNQRAIRRTNSDYDISLADILQHSGKKQKEAAEYLDVSVSTLKRICRKHQIPRWPPRRKKHHDGPSCGAQGLVQSAANEIVKDSLVKQLPLPIHQVEQDFNSTPKCTENAMAVENDSSITVKVKYKNKMIKFYLSVSSGKIALEDETAKRFGLSIGSFVINYLDKDEDLILVTCDEDLKTCISEMRSLGKDTVKMSVNLSQDT